MSEPVNGPAMIAATAIMKPGRQRLGKMFGVTFTRTIDVVTLVGVSVGALVGLATGLLFGMPIMGGTLYTVMICAASGWASVNYSPLAGESLWTWIVLTVTKSRRVRRINGERVVLGIGTTVLPRPPMGPVWLARGCTVIPAGAYDERGVVRTPANRNVDPDAVGDLARVRQAAGPVPALEHAGYTHPRGGRARRLPVLPGRRPG